MFIKSLPKRIQQILEESQDGLLHMPGQIGPPDYYAASQSLSLNQSPNVNPVTLASAATNTLDYFVTKISGTVSSTLFKIPTGLRGLVRVIIPTGLLPLATGGTYAASDGTYESLPIAASITVTRVNAPIYLISDGLLLYPILSA